MSSHYFAGDGSYGNTEMIVIVDTTNWDLDDWHAVEDCTDVDRVAVACEIAAARRAN